MIRQGLLKRHEWKLCLKDILRSQSRCTYLYLSCPSFSMFWNQIFIFSNPGNARLLLYLVEEVLYVNCTNFFFLTCFNTLRLARWPIWRNAHTPLSAVYPGFESRPSYKLSSRCFTGRVIHSMCVPSLGWTVHCVSSLLALVDVKDPTGSFAKVGELSLAP